MNCPAASYGVSSVMPDPGSGPGQALIPAKHGGSETGIQFSFWIPAFAGMTTRGKPRGIGPKSE